MFAEVQVSCSRIRKNSEVCTIHGRILTNPATTKHFNQTREDYKARTPADYFNSNSACNAPDSFNI